MSPVVTVYLRDGCHLCEVALGDLASMGRSDFELVTVDIDTDDELLARYLERIPVVGLDGEELYDFAVDVRDLSRRLDAVAGQ